MQAQQQIRSQLVPLNLQHCSASVDGDTGTKTATGLTDTLKIVGGAEISSSSKRLRVNLLLITQVQVWQLPTTHTKQSQSQQVVESAKNQC